MQLKVHNIKDINDLSNYTYIGRGTIFGNPFKLDGNNRDSVISKFSNYAKNNPELLIEIFNLDKDLVCHCKPKKCHGDVILDIKHKLDSGEMIIPNKRSLSVFIGRQINDYSKFKLDLDNFLVKFPYEVDILISGGVSSGSSLIRRYADEKGILSGQESTDNEAILNSHHVLVFWDGVSDNILNIMKQAKTFNKPISTITNIVKQEVETINWSGIQKNEK